MKKIVFSIALLGGISANAQQLLEVLKPRGGFVDNFVQSEKCLELVYDRNYGDGEHDFIYCAVQGPNGKKWLNLNLGAEYAKESSEYFNPEAQPIVFNDWKSFGSLFEAGREADGHELVDYFHSNLGNAIEGSNNNWTVKRIKGIVIDADSYSTDGLIVGGIYSNRVLDNKKRFENNPCPNNYRVANLVDYVVLMNSNKMQFFYNGFYSTSMFYNQDYPNLRIVSAPITYNLKEDVINNYYQNTRTPYTGGTWGTSGFWATIRKEEAWYQGAYGLVEDNIIKDTHWSVNMAYEGFGADDVDYIDFGYHWSNGYINLYSDIVEYNNQPHTHTASIRCVEM